MIDSWVYRARQFFGAALGRVSIEEMEQARQVLGNDLYSMFAALPMQYRRHGLYVYTHVCEAGCDDSYVWQAALLHDAGKYDPATGRYVTIAHRVVIVLLEAMPAGRPLLKRLSRPIQGKVGPARAYLLYPFYLDRHHAHRGAQRAQEHGASGEVANLIAQHHHYTGQSSRMRALQAADDRS